MLKVFTAFLVLVFIAACDESGDEKQSRIGPYRDKLRMVSPTMHKVSHDVRGNKLTSCDIAEKWSKKNDNSETKQDRASDEVLELIISSSRRGCELWTKVVEQTEPVLKQIVSLNMVPKGIYTFEMFSGENENYTKERVGPFSGIDACRKIEEEFHGGGMGTALCKEWTEWTE